jgi:outer membrane protein OmpA-like peptidoglycan-associated protein
MRLRTLCIGAFLPLAGCAHSSMVLLPDEDGGHGEVTVRPAKGKGGETVVNQANSRVTLGTANPSVRPLGAKGLKPQEALLLSQLPPPARSFTLYFLEGTTELTPQSAPTLDALRAEIARRPGAEIQVTGYTDTVGSSDDNDALSRKRAAEILEALARKGFDRSVMSAVGRGERDLKVPTGDNVGNAANRRVEVIVR